MQRFKTAMIYQIELQSQENKFDGPKRNNLNKSISSFQISKEALQKKKNINFRSRTEVFTLKYLQNFRKLGNK